MYKYNDDGMKIIISPDITTYCYVDDKDNMVDITDQIPYRLREFVKRMKLPNAKMAFMSTLLGLKDAEIISNKLVSIKSPTMIVWGENDPVIPVKYAESFVSAINDCRFVKMLDCGHTPYVDNPDTFSNIVLEFLK